MRNNFDIKHYSWILAIIWTVIISTSFIWNISRLKHSMLEIALIQARSSYEKDIIYRRWNSIHGGVYVPVTKNTQPNPYLHDIPERDIKTPSDKTLTLINPAYMTRQIFELGEKEYGIRSHITSLKPIRLENKPYFWEIKALQAFEKGIKEFNSIEKIDNKEYLLFMRPLITEKPCLKCHLKHGYKENEVRGGISVLIPLEPLWSILHLSIKHVAFMHVVIWIFGIVALLIGSIKLNRSEKSRNEAEEALKEAYENLEHRVIERTAELEESKNIIQSENELYKKLEELHSSILIAIPHAIIGLKNRTIIFANEAVENVFGWRPDEIIGKKTRILYRNDEDYERIGNLFYPLLEKQKSHIEDFPCVRKDGQEIICRISASVIGKKMEDKGIVVMYEDITRQKNIEKNLQENERKYRELVQNANSIILRWNSKGEITFMNEFGQVFFGYSEQEIIGKPVIGTIVPETESTGRDLRPLMDQICADPKAFERNVNENIKRDGSRVWIAWTNKAVFDQQGQIIEVLSIGSDITESKRLGAQLDRYREHLEELVKERTQQLEKLNKELEEANSKLKELDRLKSMFIASMSHELRTPLNSIIGFTGMTLQGLSGPLNEEQKDNLSRAYKSAKHLLEMITDIIDISKIESGRIDLFLEEISIRNIIEESLNTIEPQLKEKNLSLEIDIPSDFVVRTDKKRLRQCLINLLSNAVKYTEKGRIKITVRSKMQDEKDFIEIIVEDTGIGIAEKDIPKLFEAFERIDTHLRVKTGGTGLGLYLTKKIANDILKGSVSVKSKEGYGSTFTLIIPKKV